MSKRRVANLMPPATLLEPLLSQSAEFEGKLQRFFDEPPTLEGAPPRIRLAAVASTLSIEHAFMVRAAFELGAPSSAAALLRLQYEALLRAAWSLYAASDLQVGKLSSELSLEAELAAKNLPGLKDMLESVKKGAPAGLSAPLEEFYVNSRHALNSFVHTGIHALRRHQDGFPEPLAVQLIQMSNGLLHFAYRMLASFSGQAKMNAVTRIYVEFADCLPVHKT